MSGLVQINNKGVLKMSRLSPRARLVIRILAALLLIAITIAAILFPWESGYELRN